MTVTLRELTDANRAAVLALRVAPGQEHFVSTVRQSLAEAAAEPGANPWYRAIHVGDGPVGFVMVSRRRPPMLWKLLVDARHQRRGYGAAAVRLVAGLARADGATQLLVSYETGEGGPAGFYARLGFVETGDVDPSGEIIAGLALP